MNCWNSLETMCKKIVCPTRHADFNEHDMMERRFRRNIPPYEIFFIPNGNGINLSVLAIMVDRNNLPTVLYLHGNGGHKMEALQLADHRINLVSFDFSACGKSEGDYVTYGEREAKDVAAVVDELKRRYGIKKIIIWGRSMGASIGIMYASLFPREVSCLVLDSPFRWLKEVVKNVAAINNGSLPNFVINFGLMLIQGKLEQIIGSNIFATDFKMYLNLLEVPAMFIYSRSDLVVKEEDVRQLYEAYKGYKQLKAINVMHHEDRPKDMISDALKFALGQEGSISSRSVRASTVFPIQKKGISMSIRGHFKHP